MDNKNIYWDSCAFIHLFQQTPAWHDPLAEMMAKAENGEYEIVTSAVTLAEVYKLPELGIFPIEQSDKIIGCMENKYLNVWQADRFICKEAHHIMRLHEAVKPMDAIHLATAIAAKVNFMITTDTKKYRREGLLAHDGKIGNPALKIKTPTDGSIGGLFDSQW